MTDKPNKFRGKQQDPTPPEADDDARYEEGTFSDPKVRAKWQKGGKYYHLREDVRNPRTKEEKDAYWEAFQKEFGYGPGPE